MTHIEKAYVEGMNDALAGRDYSNPYINEDAMPNHEESYDRGFEAYYQQEPVRFRGEEIDLMGMSE